MVDLYYTGVWSVKHTCAHMQCIHTRPNAAAMTRSDVSRLMSTPLTSHTSAFHTHAYTHNGVQTA